MKKMKTEKIVGKTEYIRLQKYLSMAGIASRRAAEKMMEEGLVRVNGKIAKEPGTKVDPDHDAVTVRGKLAKVALKKSYYLFYKPVGCLTTVKDDKERITIFHYLKGLKEKVVPVGRLDFNSEGLLLLTNDGELAHAMTHPSRHLVKTYHVRVRGIPPENKLKKLEGGFILDDGEKAAPLKATLIRTTGKNAWIQFELREGKYRQIRRMCEKIGHTVSKLKRVEIGPLKCAGLRPGEYRHLEQKELSRLKVMAGIRGKRQGAGLREQGAEGRKDRTFNRLL